MNRVNRLLFAVISIAAMIMAPTAALAAPTAAAQNPGQGLELHKPVIEATADPGQTITLQIPLRNITGGPLVVDMVADDFNAGGESGVPHILIDEKEATRFSLKFWVQPIAQFSLAPNELRTIPVQVVLPGNAEPGGHYGVVRFTGLPAGISGTGVSTNASIGPLVFLKVSGPVTEKLDIAEFYASKADKRGAFFQNGPLVLTERIHNGGSVHEKPAGTVKVRDMFGHQVASLKVNDRSNIILPDSTRKFEQTLNKKALFGHYSASLSAAYANGKTLTAHIGFWVIPWSLLLAVLVILIVLYFFIRWAIRRYNQYIIEQAKRR